MRRLLSLALVAALVSGCGVSGGTRAESRPKAEPRLPAVTLKPLRDSDRPVDLSSIKGPLVINLWAQWCGPCREELPIYQEFHTKHDDVQVLGVDTLDPLRDKAIAMLEESGATYPQVVDPDRHFGPNPLPKVILVDADGKVAFERSVEIKSLGQLEKLVQTHLGVS